MLLVITYAHIVVYYELIFILLFFAGVVALFTLPKIYEANKEQIDQNLALMQAKINEITAK